MQRCALSHAVPGALLTCAKPEPQMEPFSAAVPLTDTEVAALAVACKIVGAGGASG